MNIEQPSVEILDNNDIVCNGCKLYYVRAKVNDTKQKAQRNRPPLKWSVVGQPWIREPRC